MVACPQMMMHLFTILSGEFIFFFFFLYFTFHTGSTVTRVCEYTHTHGCVFCVGKVLCASFKKEAKKRGKKNTKIHKYPETRCTSTGDRMWAAVYQLDDMIRNLRKIHKTHTWRKKKNYVQTKKKKILRERFVRLLERNK